MDLVKHLLSHLVTLAMALGAAAAVWYFGIRQPLQTLDRLDTTVQGTIVSADVTTTSEGREGTGYLPHVEYRYKFDGKTYTHDQLRPEGFRISFDSSREARRSIDEYSAGDDATVHLDASSPQLAVLRPVGPSWLLYLALAVALLSAGFISWKTVVSTRNKLT